MDRNNIYVGNRYVPIFANPVEWDNLRSYEPLTIVTYHGTSYTSKKQVPVGTALSNTDYWVVTGNYNEQVEEYRQDVLEYKDEVDEYKDTTDKVNSLVTERKFIFIGDSYNTNSSPYPWGTTLISRLGLTLNVNAWNSGLGGASFGAGTYLSQLAALENTIPNDTKELITDIVLLGSINDAAQADGDIVAGVQNFETECITNFPNAKITIILGSWSYSTQYAADTLRAGAINAYNVIHQAAKHSKVVNAFYNLLTPLSLAADRTHPSEYGATLINQMMNNIINGGDVFIKDIELSSTFNAITVEGSITIKGRIDNTGMRIYKKDRQGLNCNSITLLPDTYTNIATLTNSANTIFMKDAEFNADAMIAITSGGSVTYYNTTLLLKVIQSGSDFRLQAKNIRILNGSYTVSNVTSIILNIDTNLGYFN